MKKKSKSSGKQQKNNKKSGNKLRLALKNKFYLEAAWVISSFLEKRLKNILNRVEMQHSVPGNLFDQHIKRIKHLYLTTGNPLLTEYFNIPMIDGLRAWKNQRNEAMKDMLVRHVSDERLERLANDGVRIMKEWNTAYKRFKNNIKSQG